jgi:hypothetical protein
VPALFAAALVVCETRQFISTGAPEILCPPAGQCPNTVSRHTGAIELPRGCRTRRAPKCRRSLVFVSLYQASPPLGVGLMLGAIFSLGVFAGLDPGRSRV